MPPLKGEVPAKQVEGFANADFGNFDLWFPKPSTDPAEASGYRLSLPPLKGEVPAKRVEGFANADLGRFNVWRPMAVDRTRGS